MRRQDTAHLAGEAEGHQLWDGQRLGASAEGVPRQQECVLATAGISYVCDGTRSRSCCCRRSESQRGATM